jgi:type IV secretion system protein TrbL
MLSIAGIFGSLFHGVAGDILKVLAGAILDALKDIIVYVTTFWVKIPTPELAGQSGAPSAPVGYLQGHLQWFVGAAAVFSIFLGCGRMAWEQRGEHGREIVKGMLLLVIVSGCSLTIIQLAVTVSDSFSTWILSQSLNGVGSAELGTAFAAQLGVMLGVSTLAGGPVPVFLAIVLGCFAVIASIVQAFLMIVRGGMLVVLTGVLPLTFAFWSSEAGRGWSKRSVSWLIAFVLYKPAAAIIYATAFQLVSSTGGTAGLVNVFTGLTLMMLAILALPALMRFVTPMVGQVAAGGTGAALGAIAGAAAAGLMPSGAVSGVTADVASSTPAASGAKEAASSGPAASASAAQRTGAATLGGQLGSSANTTVEPQED